MKSEGGVSIIPCKVNGLNLNFIFDTGASDVSISITEASFMLKNGYLDGNDIIGISNYLDANGNISEGIIINLREIEIAGMKMYDVKASIVKNLKAPLLLGQSAISQLGTFQLNLKSNTLTIFKEPNKASNQNTNIEKPYSYLDFTMDFKDSKKYFTFYNQGIQKYLFKDYDGAIIDFNKAIEINPKSSNAFYMVGKSHEFKNENDEALFNYSKAIEINSLNSDAYFSRGYLKGMSEDYTGAILDLSKAIEIKPKDPENYAARGLTKSQLKDYRGAILDYNKSIQYNPNNEDIYVLRGDSKSSLNYYAEAILDYNKAIKINPKCSEAYYSRGISKGLLKQTDEACKDLSKAGELGYIEAYELIKELCN